MEATVQYDGEPFIAGTSCAAHFYSDELHFYDISVADPRHPIPKSARKSYSQEYRGFGLMDAIMKAVRQCADERGCRTITLTAAHRPLNRCSGATVSQWSQADWQRSHSRPGWASL